MRGETSEGQRRFLATVARLGNGVVPDHSWMLDASRNVHSAGLVSVRHVSGGLWRIVLTEAGRTALSAASTGADDAG